MQVGAGGQEPALIVRQTIANKQHVVLLTGFSKGLPQLSLFIFNGCQNKWRGVQLNGTRALQKTNTHMHKKDKSDPNISGALQCCSVFQCQRVRMKRNLCFSWDGSWGSGTGWGGTPKLPLASCGFPSCSSCSWNWKVIEVSDYYRQHMYASHTHSP